MLKQYKTLIIVVAIAHVVLLAIFFLFSGGEPESPDASLTAPEAVVPDIVVDPPPPVVAPVPDKPVRKPRPPIIPSTNIVVRETSSAPEVPVEEVAELVNELIDTLSPTTTPTIVVDRPARSKDEAILYSAFHAVWQAPLRHEVGDAQVLARVIFSSDGSVTSAKIEKKSAVPALDESVELALKKVSKVYGLSKEALNKRDGITVIFEVAE